MPNAHSRLAYDVFARAIQLFNRESLKDKHRFGKRIDTYTARPMGLRAGEEKITGVY
jgi:hypothetical protein